MSHYKSETSQDVGSTSCDQYDSESNNYYNDSYEYYGSEEYCEDYWPTSRSSYNLDRSHSHETYGH